MSAKGQMRIVVLGAGAWGSTLAAVAQENGHDVALWSRRSGTQLAEAVAQADVVLSAIAMGGVRGVAAQLAQVKLPDRAIFVSATKGLDAQSVSSTALPLLPSQLWRGVLGERPVTVLCGPNLSKEIAQGLPAATVVASDDEAAATQIQTVFSSNRFRVYTNPDWLGVELGGTLKNVIAIAVGACDGLGLGTNAKAALMTRGLVEMIRLGSHWGAQPETFYGLSGLGDLLATCNSPLSRNYQVGYGLAQGQGLAAVLTNLEGTAEGINTTAVLMQLAAQQGMDLPITSQVARLLRGEVTPQAATAALMLRDRKPEVG
jgi:glycerol-3-phosphate dehydrogenase (NAD(P)+)